MDRNKKTITTTAKQQKKHNAFTSCHWRQQVEE